MERIHRFKTKQTCILKCLFFVYFHSFQQQFTQINCRLKWDMNWDCHSSRRAVTFLFFIVLTESFSLHEVSTYFANSMSLQIWLSIVIGRRMQQFSFSQTLNISFSLSVPRNYNCFFFLSLSLSQTLLSSFFLLHKTLFCIHNFCMSKLHQCTELKRQIVRIAQTKLSPLRLILSLLLQNNRCKKSVGYAS